MRIDRLPLSVVADIVESGVRRCVIDAGLQLTDINAVALAIPGLVEHGTGLVRSSPIFQDKDVPLSSFLAERLGVPVAVAAD